jgi:hypothetical protein
VLPPPPAPPPAPGPAIVSMPPPLPVTLDGQLDAVMVLVSRFTAPVCASSLPWIVADVFAVMVAKAMMVPTNRVPVPSVAEEPTCQNTGLNPSSPNIVVGPVFGDCRATQHREAGSGPQAYARGCPHGAVREEHVREQPEQNESTAKRLAFHSVCITPA